MSPKTKITIRQNKNIELESRSFHPESYQGNGSRVRQLARAFLARRLRSWRWLRSPTSSITKLETDHGQAEHVQDIRHGAETVQADES